MNYLLDTNILIYHTTGSEVTISFIGNIVTLNTLNISILTKIEFLGWDKHTSEGFEKCKALIEVAKIYTIDENVANKAIELKRKSRIKLGDAVIAATAIIHNLKLATRNVDDFKDIEGLQIFNPFQKLCDSVNLTEQ